MAEEYDEEEGLDAAIVASVDEETGLRHFEMTVSEGRRVVLRELNVAEFGSIVDQGGGDWALVMRGVRRSLVSDRGEPIRMEQTAGVLMSKRFNVREVMAMRTLWQQVHMIGERQLSSIQAFRVG